MYQPREHPAKCRMLVCVLHKYHLPVRRREAYVREGMKE